MQSKSPNQTTSLSRSIGISLSLALLFLAALLLLHHALPAIQPIDRTLQSSIHAQATPTLTLLAKALTAIGSPHTVWPLTIFLATILWLRRPRRPAYLLALTMATSGTLETLIKLLAQRSRPALPWAYVHEHSYSFPSGHATLAIALYGILTWIAYRTPHPRWQRGTALILAASLIPAIGLSRLYLGAHYPTDVLAGYLTGAATLAVVIAADLAL